MADETHDEPRPDDETPETEPSEDERDSRLAVNAADGDSTGEDDEESNDPAETDPDGTTPRVASASNRQVVGQLTLHYASRDVRIPVDGDAAMRIMSAHQVRTNRGMGDLLLPVSSARDGWVTLDADEPLAISWLPELPLPEARMAIDPAM